MNSRRDFDKRYNDSIPTWFNLTCLGIVLTAIILLIELFSNR